MSGRTQLCIGILLSIVCVGSFVLAVWSGDWRWLIATVISGIVVIKS